MILVLCPLSLDSETALQELQLEMTDLQCNFIRKEKLSCIKLEEFYATLASQSIRQRAQKTLSSMCEISKARHRPQLTVELLRSLLWIDTTKMTPNFDVQTKKKVGNNTVLIKIESPT